ncbi:MAG: hypothetical protein RLY16_1883 [Bacteroidota bacterium]|jgi:iron complex outermembrane receptor protein
MKMKVDLKVRMLVILLVMAIFVEAKPIVKGQLSGVVTDAQTHQPIVGASVFVTDLRIGASTKTGGYYQLSNIPEGSHLIEVSHIGYSTMAFQVEVKGATTFNVELSSTVVENNAVVVTGVSGATQMKKTPFQVMILRKEELLQNASTNLIEGLTKKPGISSLSTGPAISKPIIRGLGYNRVLTIHDGVRQEGQQWGEEHGIEIDDASVGKVEILKGPASLMYGSDAMAGVINIISEQPLPNNTMRANILTQYQTNNKSRNLHANWGGNINGINWNIYGTTQAAADYQNAFDGHVFNSKFKQHNVGGQIGYNASWGYSHLIVSNYNLKAGLIEGERDEYGYFIKPIAGGETTRATKEDFNSTTPMFPYQHIRHAKIAFDNRIKLGTGRLNFTLGYQRNQREEFGDIDAPDERELFFDLKSLTYRAQYQFAEKNGWSTAIGATGMHQTNTNRGVEQLIPNYTSNDAGAFIFSKKSLKKTTWSMGARFDSRKINAENLMDGTDIKGNSFSSSFSNFSASLGLASQLNQQLNVKLNIARAFRAPSLPELASNGAHEGTTRYEYGNLNLKSETSYQLDAGLEFTTEHVSFNLGAYYNNFNNFIYYRKLEAAAGGDSLVVNEDGESLEAFTFSQQGAILSGMEATIDFHPHPLDWLHIENTFSFVRGRLKEKVEGSDFLPFIPAPRLITEVRANFPKIENNVRNFYAKLELDNTFAQDNIFTAYSTETATPGYSLLNAGIGADLVNKAGNPWLKIYFAANNLTDRSYQNHLSRLKYTATNMATNRVGVFNMGRNFSIKLLIPLQFKVSEK